MRTNTRVNMSFVDVTALPDATVTANAKVSISDLSVLEEENFFPDYATTERNFFVLDGSKDIMSDTPDDIGFMSSGASNSERNYTTNPKLTVNFTENHTSAGITLYFGSDYPSEVKVTWYDSVGLKLDGVTFSVDKVVYFCDHQVENYRKIEIEVTKSGYPFRYTKLSYILYGVNVVFENEEVQNASIIEELDPTSATLSVNTASISVVDPTETYNPSNHNGLWKSIQVGQEILITEIVDDTEVNCGSFYMESWDYSKNLASFNLIDKIGMLDKTYFYDGQIYNDTPASTILTALFNDCGVENYTLEEELGQITLSGHLGVMTHREALQQIVFAIGGVADCSRSDYINIYKPKRYVENYIGIDRKFLGTSVKLEEYVSGVTVAFNKYSLSSETSKVYDDLLPVGSTKIVFSTPIDPTTLTVSAGTVVNAKTNYAIINMTAEGTCTVQAKQYDATSNAITVNVNNIEGGEVENIKEYSGCTLVNSARALEIAKYILNYLQLRQIVEMRFLNQGEGVGEWCQIADASTRFSITGITKQSINLTGGNIASVTSRGYSAVVTYYYYTGEIYGGDAIGVM